MEVTLLIYTHVLNGWRPHTPHPWLGSDVCKHLLWASNLSTNQDVYYRPSTCPFVCIITCHWSFSPRSLCVCKSSGVSVVSLVQLHNVLNHKGHGRLIPWMCPFHTVGRSKIKKIKWQFFPICKISGRSVGKKKETKRKRNKKKRTFQACFQRIHVIFEKSVGRK